MRTVLLSSPLLCQPSVVVFFVVSPLPALPGQNQPQPWSPVLPGHHRLDLPQQTTNSWQEPPGWASSSHLTGLDHTAQLGLDLLETVRDVVQVDAPAAVIHQDGPEAELLGVEGCGGWQTEVLL